jgi:hypothetical protein
VYLNEKFELGPVTAKVQITSLNFTCLEFTLAQDVEGCQGGGLEAGSIALVARDIKTVADELARLLLL